MPKMLKLVISLALPFVAGFIGNFATLPSITTWYADLEKPFFNPPNWIFGPVWTLLYILIGIALYLVWTKTSKHSKQLAFGWFGIQLILNTCWSLVFFGLHMPWAGVVVILLLLVSIITTMRYFWRFSQLATFLLIPYIAWVSFATTLNIAVAFLN